jgi:galactose mutarotase-like enzyme
LRECHSPVEKVLDSSCFPLVPYVNRISDDMRALARDSALSR